LEKNLVAYVQLLLASGQTLHVRGVQLYPANELARIAGLRAEAAQKMGGVSSGIGFYGSLGWVIEASAALGIIEAVLSDSSKKAGLRLLVQADQLSVATCSLSKLFQIEGIKHIERPHPGAWTAEMYGRNGTFTTTYAHTGDDFLGVETENGFMSIRWSSVVGYVGPSLPEGTRKPPSLPEAASPVLTSNPLPDGVKTDADAWARATNQQRIGPLQTLAQLDDPKKR
jgi:hypothetical protein